jgi:hypothetical protein
MAMSRKSVLGGVARIGKGCRWEENPRKRRGAGREA